MILFHALPGIVPAQRTHKHSRDTRIDASWLEQLDRRAQRCPSGDFTEKAVRGNPSVIDTAFVALAQVPGAVRGSPSCIHPARCSPRCTATCTQIESAFGGLHVRARRASLLASIEVAGNFSTAFMNSSDRDRHRRRETPSDPFLGCSDAPRRGLETVFLSVPMDFRHRVYSDFRACLACIFVSSDYWIKCVCGYAQRHLPRHFNEFVARIGRGWGRFCPRRSSWHGPLCEKHKRDPARYRSHRDSRSDCNVPISAYK
jgi:hypothetical protein